MKHSGQKKIGNLKVFGMRPLRFAKGDLYS